MSDIIIVFAAVFIGFMLFWGVLSFRDRKKRNQAGDKIVTYTCHKCYDRNCDCEKDIQE